MMLATGAGFQGATDADLTFSHGGQVAPASTLIILSLFPFRRCQPVLWGVMILGLGQGILMRMGLRLRIMEERSGQQMKECQHSFLKTMELTGVGPEQVSHGVIVVKF